MASTQVVSLAEIKGPRRNSLGSLVKIHPENLISSGQPGHQGGWCVFCRFSIIYWSSGLFCHSQACSHQSSCVTSLLYNYFVDIPGSWSPTKLLTGLTELLMVEPFPVVFTLAGEDRICQMKIEQMALFSAWFQF